MQRRPDRQLQRNVALLFVAVVACYTLIACFYYWPMIREPGRVIAGWIDARENYWNLWWAKKVLLHGPGNPYQAGIMQYPFGISLLFHTLNLVNGVLSLPFQLFGGVAFAYNAVNMLALVLAGSGMFALVWYLTRSSPAAFAGGLIYAFNPYIAFHADAGQTNLLSIEWMPWYFLALLLGLRRSWIWLPVAALLLVVNALTDWHYVVFLALITSLTALYEAQQLKHPRAILLLLGKLGLVGAVFAIIAAPVLLPMLREMSSDPSVTRDLEDSLNHSADLLAFVLPSPFHPIWGAWAASIFYGRLVPPNMVGGLASVGFGTLLLALVGGVSRRRDWALFAVIAAAGAVLALGPYLRINGSVVQYAGGPVPLPYIWFNRLPFMTAVRVPSRFVLVTMFGLAVLAGFGVAALGERFGTGRRSRPVQSLLLLAIGGLLLFEYWPAPFKTTPTTPDQVSAFYRWLGSDHAEYAIADVPYEEARSMFFQTFHNKATLGARIARPKPHPWLDARFFGPLLHGAPPVPDIGADESVAAWHAALACQKVRYVVFYKNIADRKRLEQSRQLEATLFDGTIPVYEDRFLRAYGPVAGTAKEAYWTPLAEEWYDPESSPDGATFRWLNGDHGTLLAYPCGARSVMLRFEAYSFARPRTLEIRIDGRLVRTIDLPAEMEHAYEVPLELRDGENHISFRSVQPATLPADRGFANDTRSISIMFTQVSLQQRVGPPQP